MQRRNARPHLARHVLEFSVPEIAINDARRLEFLVELVAVNLRIDLAGDVEDVGPAVVVVVHKARAPAHELRVQAHPGKIGDVAEGPVLVVVVEVRGVVGKIGLEDVETAVAVVIGHAQAHAGLLLPVLVVGAAGEHRNVGERPVVFVLEEDARLRIHRHVDIRPAVVVEIVGHGGDGVTRAGLRDARPLGDVLESPVAVVVIENVRAAGQAARPTHRRDAFPLAHTRFARGGDFLEVEVNVVADKKVEQPVAVIVEPAAARTPTHPLVPESGPFGYIGECAVTIVTEENVVAPVSQEEVVPAVIVVVPDANTHAPPRPPNARLFGDVNKSPVAAVLEEVRVWLLARRPGGVEPRAVGEVNVQPAVLVVIEKRDAAALRLDNVLFVLDAAPHVRNVEARFAGDVHVGDGRKAFRVWRGRREKPRRFSPFPKRRRQHLQKFLSEKQARSAEKVSPRGFHVEERVSTRPSRRAAGTRDAVTTRLVALRPKKLIITLPSSRPAPSRIMLPAKETTRRMRCADTL